MEWDIKKVVDRISYFRTKKNLSARKLSMTIGKSEPYIHSLENGGFDLPLKVLLDIFEVLEISPVEFFSENPEQYKKDLKLLEFFSKLSEKQKDAIFNLYNQLIIFQKT